MHSIRLLLALLVCRAAAAAEQPAIITGPAELQMASGAGKESLWGTKK